MKETIQIIGKVTGLDRAQCVAKFAESQLQLEARGYEVINPLTLVPEHAEWNPAMRICLAKLLTVDAVALQPDWYLSEGAKLEYMVASALQLKMIRI